MEGWVRWSTAMWHNVKYRSQQPPAVPPATLVSLLLRELGRMPDHRALLQAMIGRLIDRFEELREQIRLESAPNEIPNELVVEVKMLSSLDEASCRCSAALLAVAANQPGLMEQFHERQRKRFSERILSSEHPERSTILFLAAVGLHYTSLLNISILDKEQRRRIYADLARLASGDMEI